MTEHGLPWVLATPRGPGQHARHLSGDLQHQTPPQTPDRGYALDNASLHRSRAIREARLELKEQGIGLWYLPPYTPERNDIERTFRDAKHSP